MWRVYKHTGKDTDYDGYKEALNAATNEVRKSKRNFEHKLAQNIKSDSKSFYAYVRSKQNVRDKVGPLEENFGNIVTQGFLMAEELNMHFSSVFTREDTSSLPVPETKFKGSEGERLGQLVVTPEVVASNINNTSRVPVEGKSSVCLICMEYRIIFFELLSLSAWVKYIVYCKHITHARTRAHVRTHPREHPHTHRHRYSMGLCQPTVMACYAGC